MPEPWNELLLAPFADQHAGTSRGVALENRARAGQRADIPAGTAGETAQTVRSGARCGEGGRVRAGGDCREVGAQ